MTNKTIKPIFGIEVECVYDPDIIGTIRVAEYHHARSPTFSSNFYAEEDSSIDEYDDDGDYIGNCAELISIPFQSKDVDKIISSFMDTTYDKISRKKKLTIQKARDKFALKDIFDFNRSCGCHLNVTPLIVGRSDYRIRYKGTEHVFKGTPFPLRLFATVGFLNTLEKAIKSKVQRDVPKVYPKFNSQFFRSHASKVENMYHAYYGRRSFNLSKDLYHMEIRSFNLHGVKTWDEFDKVIKAGIFAVEEAFNKEYNSEKGFTDTQEFKF